MAFIKSGDRKECLFCQTIVLFEEVYSNNFRQPGNRVFLISIVRCPSCYKFSVSYQIFSGTNMFEEAIILPISSGRIPAPKEVPDFIADDYNEACLVLPFSGNASAALARRCLQSILTNYAETTSKNLSSQIDEVLNSLPTHISENLDSIRQVGNFAAHEQKSTQTGSILDVEPNEAEWTLDILESLFDFYFVGPAKAKEKREALNKKLEEAGKPAIKQPNSNGEK